MPLNIIAQQWSRAARPVADDPAGQRRAATVRRGSTPGRRRVLRPAPEVSVSIVIALIALALRLVHVVASYNLFIDEVTYAEIARNIAAGHGVTHYGEPFDLHPPVALGTFAAGLRLLGSDGSLADLAFRLRVVPALFGAATAALCYPLARRCGLGRVPALAGAALIALDPFQISYDSRVMLEAPTQFLAAATVLLLITAARAEPGGGATGGPRRLLLAAAGLCAGLTFCSKETFGLVLGAALLVLIVQARPLRRRDTGAVLALAAGVYLVNLLATIVLGGLDAWVQARGNGLTRLVGLNKETGFTSDTVQVSLVSRLTANLDQLAVTYLLLVLGGLCCLLLVYRLGWRPAGAATGQPSAGQPPTGQPPTGQPPAGAVVVTAWALSACGYLMYATVFGSIEEQMYYIPLLPCVLCLVTVAGTGRRGATGVGRRAGPARGVLLALLLTLDLVVWTRVHTVDDNAYRQFFSWAEHGLPVGSRVAVTEDSAQFVLQDVEVGSWHTLGELRSHRVDYVLINPQLVEQGYGVGDPVFLEQLRERARVVFAATSERDGALLLFDVRALTGSDR